MGLAALAGLLLCDQRLQVVRAQARPPANGYIDSAACAACHPSVWESYRRTGMGRSFYRPKPDNTVEDYSRKNTYFHLASDAYFTMIERDGRYLQREYQLGFDGQQTNIVEQQIDFVVGSGNHSRTYLHRTSRNTLVELPLAWYAEKGGYWAMNPGYDRPDHRGFGRLIGYECMFCHNGYADLPPGNPDPDAQPVFSKIPEGIDCQRCHGPGEKHVRLARDRAARREDIRAAIVNPARLTPERRMEVCMQCHLETTSFSLPHALVRYERGPFSYRPGEPLGEFMLHFDQAPGQGEDDKFEIAGAAYRLRRSACFRKSNRALECTTCHDPHATLLPADAARHYTAVCRQCHGVALNRLVASGQHSRSSDCVGCHMPKRRTDDVVHVVMTDHYIQRRKPARDLLAEMAERQPAEGSGYRGEVVLYYPASPPKPEDELYLAIAQVRDGSNLGAGIARLSAAIERYHPERAEYSLQLADALRSSGKFEQAVPLYEESLRRRPDSLANVEKLALCFLTLHQQTRAVEILRSGLDRAPGDAGGWHMLGFADVEAGKTADGLAAFQKAIELDPEMPEAYNSLGSLWFHMGDMAKAEPALRNAIRLEPNYAEAHDNLGNVLSATGHFDEARYHFEAALRYRTNYSSARYNYAVALARAGRLNEAQAQIEAGLRGDSGWSDGHEFLGTLLAAQGQLRPAMEHYREALRIRPDFSRAQLHLGEALADSGDAAGGLPYLQKAAASSDPAIRQEARGVIEKLQKRR